MSEYCHNNLNHLFEWGKLITIQKIGGNSCTSTYDPKQIII